MKNLPQFSPQDYRKTIQALKKRGSSFLTMGEMRKATGSRNLVFLRHDIDCHPAGVVEMAELEREEAVVSTFFVLLTSHYNPRSRSCRPILKQLVQMGHEIGLHYDLSTYPEDADLSLTHLRYEASVLAELTGAPVCSISCHHPHAGLPDWFKESDEFIHCHDQRLNQDILYVSDSARAWRNTNLLDYINGTPDQGPRGIQLLTHPEVWHGGEYTSRIDYLDNVLLPLTLKETQLFADVEMRQIWLHHEGVRLHDLRMEGEASMKPNDTSRESS